MRFADLMKGADVVLGGDHRAVRRTVKIYPINGLRVWNDGDFVRGTRVAAPAENGSIRSLISNVMTMAALPFYANKVVGWVDDGSRFGKMGI